MRTAKYAFTSSVSPQLWCQKWDLPVFMAESESEKTSKKDIKMTMSAEQVRTLVQELLQALPNRNPPVQPLSLIHISEPTRL